MIVNVKQGALKGIACTSVLTGKEYYSFFGIPYAKPPLGPLRFQAPQPAEKWKGVLDATKEGNMCCQKDELFTKAVLGSEDCLFLNVYTPEPPSKIMSPKPVMVYVHGGGFVCGASGDGLYCPDYLMNYDIIFVSMNYRLHALGFLNLGLPECPGNVGLKDQLLALEWVKENIAFFGGDNKNITLFGESAGAASVNYHMISPLSRKKDLFQRCILQSGNSFAEWAYSFNPVENAFSLGKMLGYEGTDKKELLEFFREIPAEKLTYAVADQQDELMKTYTFRCIPFVFIPSKEEIKEGALIPEDPDELQKKASPIPVITGCTDLEGLLGFRVHPIEFHIEGFTKDPTRFVRHNYGIDGEIAEKLTEKIKKFYFGDNQLTPDMVQQFIDLYSDFVMVKETYNSVEFVLEKGYPVYAYLFSYDSEMNVFKKLLGGALPNPPRGACHGDDLRYMFLAKLLGPPILIPDNLQVIRNVCTLWTNFAKTGDPNGGNINVTWSQSTTGKPTYLVIDKELTPKDGKVFEERMDFWKNVKEDFPIIRKSPIL